MKIIYGTGNSAKIAYMRRALKKLPPEIPSVEIQGLYEAARERGISLPQVEERGSTPLENAREKAEQYFALFQSPVFSCDSGLYLWDHRTGMPLPEEDQPGIHVRGRDMKRRSDEELLSHYIGLVKKYGRIRARYKNAICLIWDEHTRAESEAEELWGTPFLLTDVPHVRRVEGFPLDSISLDLKTQEYFYDREKDLQDDLVSHQGFTDFFYNFLKKG